MSYCFHIFSQHYTSSLYHKEIRVGNARSHVDEVETGRGEGEEEDEGEEGAIGDPHHPPEYRHLPLPRQQLPLRSQAGPGATDRALNFHERARNPGSIAGSAQRGSGERPGRQGGEGGSRQNEWRPEGRDRRGAGGRGGRGGRRRGAVGLGAWGPEALRRPRKGADARVLRQAAAGGGAAGGERRRLRAAAPLRRGAANCSTPGSPLLAGSSSPSPGAEGPARPRSLRRPAPPRLVPARG